MQPRHRGVPSAVSAGLSADTAAPGKGKPWTWSKRDFFAWTGGTDRALNLPRGGWPPSCQRGDFRHFVAGTAPRNLCAVARDGMRA